MPAMIPSFQSRYLVCLSLWRLAMALPPPSPVVHLTNLPTLAPASYCSEIIWNGMAVLHTKTGAVCTYNTIPPPPTASPTPSPQFTSSELDGRCMVFQEKLYDQYGQWDYRAVDGDLSLEMCTPFCSKAVTENMANNKTAATACLSWADPPLWQNFDYHGARQISQGSCLCNSEVLTSLADWFAKTAVPAIEEITCKTWMTAVNTVVTGGLAAIPGVGGVVATAAHICMQAVVTLAYTMKSGQDAATAFTNWLNAPSTQLIDMTCGKKYTSEEGQRVFDAFWTASSALGPGKIFGGAARAFPPPWPKGAGPSKELEDFLRGLTPNNGKGDKGDKPSPPSISVPKPTRPADQTRSLEPNQSRKQCTKELGKRNTKGEECERHEITSYLLVGSKAETAKTASTHWCRGKDHPQACAHYFSAIKNGAPSRFVCEDFNSRDAATATSDWRKQHTNTVWQSYTLADWKYNFRGEQKEFPDCKKDEWPPAYFLPASDAERKKTEWGQYVRWLPGPENGGAAQGWRAFCAKQDGGKGNGQRVRPRHVDRRKKVIEDDNSYNTVPFNSDLLDLAGKEQKSTSSIGKDGTTTRYQTWKDVPFTRAVFEIAFDWSGMEEPSVKNDWLLKENACWPKDIAPLDPGYVLLTNDPWYKTAAMPADYKRSVTASSLYRGAPPADMLKIAQDARPDVAKVRPAPGRTDSNSDPEPPTKKPNAPQKRLELVDDRIVMRDDQFNTSRVLTEEELHENVEIIQCADRYCREERRALGDDDQGIVTPGTGPAMLPAINAAIPTPIVGAAMVPASFSRTSFEKHLPLMTAAVSMES